MENVINDTALARLAQPDATSADTILIGRLARELQQRRRRTSYFADVGRFNAKFGLPVSPLAPPRLLPGPVQEYRVRFLKEELQEFEDCWAAADLPGAADALVDLAHVSMGTAHFMYLPFDQHWAEVDRANADKVKGDMKKARTAGLEGMGEQFEIAKPPGWRPPDHVRVLREHVAQHFPENRAMESAR